MFDPQSRYYKLEQVSLPTVAGDGTAREIKYVRRRFIPRPSALTTLVEHTVTGDDRLDNLAARLTGDPTQYWRLCDGNAAMRPAELTEVVGRVLAIGLVA